MCDFKPGDEVVCVSNSGWLWAYLQLVPPTVGEVYTVAAVSTAQIALSSEEGVGIDLIELPNSRGYYPAECFRKVHRRDLTAWLATEKTIEEPKRAPAKKRERVQ